MITRDLIDAFLILPRLSDDDTAATLIHRYFQREVWDEIKMVDRLIMYAALPLVPFVIILLTIVFGTLSGRFIKKRTDKEIIKQIYEQIRLTTRYAILSPWYYIFEWHDENKREHAGEYLNRFEIKAGLYKLLRKYTGGLPIPVERSTACIKDKAYLKARCNDKGIATTPIFWIFEKGQIRKLDWQDEKLPEIDLFVKPLSGQGGGGASRWDYLSSGQFRCSDGKVATGDQLIEYLRKASEHKAYLVQPRPINHREITDLANGTLATIRVMSCRNESDNYEVKDAVFRIARSSKTVVDNYHAGGIAVNVDIQTDELGRGTRGAWGIVVDGWYDRHPQINVPLQDRKLPCWPELIRFVQDAHGRLFSDQVVIGWDVAILDTGLCLIEANKAPDLDIIQRTRDGPVGNERLGKLLAFNLRQTIEAKYAPLEVNSLCK
ncbi:sugar-transfer associated ATP-grasp domain-containing protein [Nitrosomonas communis]|uniref:Sugar-transfer associated ATP-grasp n=1 Tax=Nitrosomonas communis TaxID=44574 RepID=A0A1I4NYY8_9PROT|nr:sugar-transfer associated ATP-grasp domain-containing protein [Nitrosomonas communis]SFM20616.1 Sugar-transfer associated ATP-grasp [Nitrosomonas communis]